MSRDMNVFEQWLSWSSLGRENVLSLLKQRGGSWKDELLLKPMRWGTVYCCFRLQRQSCLEIWVHRSVGCCEALVVESIALSLFEFGKNLAFLRCRCTGGSKVKGATNSMCLNADFKQEVSTK